MVYALMHSAGNGRIMEKEYYPENMKNGTVQNILRRWRNGYIAVSFLPGVGVRRNTLMKKKSCSITA